MTVVGTRHVCWDWPDWRWSASRSRPVGIRGVQLVTVDPDAARCPDCGQMSTSDKEWVLTRPRDVPIGGTAVLLQWRKRRWRCRVEDCPRQRCRADRRVPARTTTRLRARLATAVDDGRCQAEVTATVGVPWPTAARRGAHGRTELGEPGPTSVLGLDETRFGRPRWVRGPGGWSRSDPWETGFVDLAGGQGLLGQVDGRTHRRGPRLARAAQCRVPRCRPGGGDRPARRLRPRGARTAAARCTRGRPLPPGDARQPRGHRRPPAGHPRAAAPSRPARPTRPGPTAGHCYAPANASRTERWRGWGTGTSTTHRPGPRRLDRQGRTARAVRPGRRAGPTRPHPPRLWAFVNWCVDTGSPT